MLWCIVCMYSARWTNHESRQFNVLDAPFHTSSRNGTQIRTRRQWWFNIEGRGLNLQSAARLAGHQSHGWEIWEQQILHLQRIFHCQPWDWVDRRVRHLHGNSVSPWRWFPGFPSAMSRRFLTSPVVEADATPGATWSMMVDDELIVVQCHSFLASESYDHSYWKTNVKINESYESLLSSS